eukprot:UN03825
MREVRTVVYSQFLESYKSVTMEAMAASFGVTVDFIDQELSRFIAAGKLHCKIDKVAGVLETNRPDARNAFYQSTIKQGDFLLNRIQKLSRVIDLWAFFVRFGAAPWTTLPYSSFPYKTLLWLLP